MSALGVGLLLACMQPAWAAPETQPGREGFIKLSPAQIAALRIEVAPAGPGTLLRTVRVPGNVIMNPDRIGHVPAKVIGTVVELRKRLGDVVQKGEVVAYLESREVADAKSEFLTAGANLELQTTLFERERSLFEKKISAEQQFLRAENAFSLSKLRHDLARQKLSALDVDETEIAELPKQPVANLRRYALRSPIAGRVIDRRVDLGAPVGGDQQEKEIYVIADLSSVWVELVASAPDLALLKEGDGLAIEDSARAKATGETVFISPMVNKDTRTTRVIVSLDNAEGRWRPGSFVSANIPVDRRAVPLLLPRNALQAIDGRPLVFVQVPEGFESRAVQVGAMTEESVEVLGGLKSGEIVAVLNTFILKSELGKAKADE
ncbi:efflux RND transporter periplasmic adaptor subunit [Bradyrhizobium sp. WSM 1791]|uniref:Efflux RND transporter periplasmic adaptor subunit n=1 Tax=Bradyrhizobium australiense TaxID=2721161 RepID=A0A7Y4LV79_9BRAD|nr:efflux RND transporter periplasmic adaptor subunit [Bradyrhizobium australiense]